MKRECGELQILMTEILEKTDVMFQAIKADEFDIFENVLLERESLIDKYLRLIGDKSPTNVIMNYEQYRGKIDNLNKLIDQELKRFNDKLQGEFIENKKQLTKITSGQRISKQYQTIHEPLQSGRMFDDKK